MNMTAEILTLHGFDKRGLLMSMTTDLRMEADETIATAVQKGDTDAFGILIERYEKKLMRYARRFLFGREDVEDLLQEVFIKAYVNIRDYDATRRFSPWIYRIAHNEFVSALRKKKRSIVDYFDLDTVMPQLASASTSDDVALRGEDKALLEDSLARIDEKYREPLVLYYFEELSYEEIAQVLGVPTATVGVRLKRGREAMKKAIESNDPTYSPSA